MYRFEIECNGAKVVYAPSCCPRTLTRACEEAREAIRDGVADRMEITDIYTGERTVVTR